eukprot:NODE_465_length_7087_cov_1.060962.p7 type:complete len:108 gc:universal NODE_465_length_7087_cov_1.060962:3796-3473(-)
MTLNFFSGKSISVVKNGFVLDDRYTQLIKISASSISLNGPPFFVSSKSHFKIFSSGIPTSNNPCIAPFPHLPSAPITKTFGLDLISDLILLTISLLICGEYGPLFPL